MILDVLVTHPLIALVLSQFLGAALVLIAILVLFPRHRRALLDPVIGWARRMFTDPPRCSCDRFHTEVFCRACRKVRVLTPTSTLSTADTNVLLGQFEHAQRRREAFTAFDEIEPDLDEQAVN